MPKHPLIGTYLKNIEKELGDADYSFKKSVLQEIDEHLNEKIEDFKHSANISSLSSDDFNKIITDFGSPSDIAEEYRRQLSLDSRAGTTKKRKGEGITIVALVLIVVALLAGIILNSLIEPGEDTVEDDNTIIEGMGLSTIRIGDSSGKIIDEFGEPDETVNMGTDIWLDYRTKNGMDFLLDGRWDMIIEIRFNDGFQGGLGNGIKIGSDLDEVLNKSGGAEKTVTANLTETQGVTLGADRVLYEAKENGTTVAYKFIDVKKGVLFWFDTGEKVTQIVVFEPREF